MKFLNLFKKDKPHWPTLPPPDDSIAFFEVIKSTTEDDWAATTLAKHIYGFQIQENSKWRIGLSDAEIAEFERVVGHAFPTPLKNFYRTMNGLTKPGINIYGNDGTPFAYRPVFYSFPEDLPLLQEMIKWIYDANGVDAEKISQDGISRIFPISGHRFMLIDIAENPILSMHGNDIIYWADNLSKFLANDLVGNIWNISDFESVGKDSSEVKFWLDEERS